MDGIKEIEQEAIRYYRRSTYAHHSVRFRFTSVGKLTSAPSGRVAITVVVSVSQAYRTHSSLACLVTSRRK